MTEQTTESISFEIQKELPRLSWKSYPSNAFARQVTPEMLTSNGLQTIDVIGSRNSAVPAIERLKAIYTFDRTFVIETLKRLFERLQCDTSSFMQLCRVACNHDSEYETIAVSHETAIDMMDDYDELQPSANDYALFAIDEYLQEYRSSILPKPNEKGEYPIRFCKAVLLLEKLENILKYDCKIDSRDKPVNALTVADVKTKLARL